MSEKQTHSLAPGLTVEDVEFVSPSLAHYTQEAVMDGVWKRPELSPRDRSLITVAALIARSQTLAMPHYFDKALDSGVKASELSEIILHLAFYSGFPNAMAAVSTAKDAFQKRGISAKELPPVQGLRIPASAQSRFFRTFLPRSDRCPVKHPAE